MIGYWLFVAGVRLAERLPAPLLYALADLVGTLLSALPLAPQRRLRQNLATVLHTAPGDPAVVHGARVATRVQAANYLDLFRNRVVTGESITRQIIAEGEGWAMLAEAARIGRGAVLVTAHFGRFELFSHYLGHLSYAITCPVERISPPALFDFICRLRQRPTFHIIPHDTALRPILRALSRGEIAAFFADWDPSGQSVEVSLFGRRTHLPGGPAYAARRAGVPMFMGTMLPGPRPGTHRALLTPLPEVPRTDDLDADIQASTQEIARTFERNIGAHPELWVMFHDIWSA